VKKILPLILVFLFACTGQPEDKISSPLPTIPPTSKPTDPQSTSTLTSTSSPPTINPSTFTVEVLLTQAAGIQTQSAGNPIPTETEIPTSNSIPVRRQTSLDRMSEIIMETF